MSTTTLWCRRDSPLGTLRLAARDGALVGICFDGQKYDARAGADWREALILRFGPSETEQSRGGQR